MTETSRKTLVGALTIVAVGLVVGVANNLLAGPERKLEWKGSYPPKGDPPCLKYKPPGVEAMAAGGATGEPAAESGATGPAETTGAEATPPPAGAVEIPPVPAGERWIELQPAPVKALFDQGALFIDARRTEAYAEGHVQGSISIPIWESGVDEKIAAVMFTPQVQGDPARPIVVYCNGGDCEDSHMVGDKLWQAGHTSVYVYHDGWPNWSDNKWPMTAGSQP